MKDYQYNVSLAELTEEAIKAMSERGVELEDIAEIVLELQKPYNPSITMDQCLEHLKILLSRREVTHAILTGIGIDKAAENGHFDEPLLSIIRGDEGLYGIDEILPLSIVNISGSIGLTNFGYLDKIKPGIIKKIDTQKNDIVNTFLDDIIAALAAAAASRVAHYIRY